jgi:hypothetical protein
VPGRPRVTVCSPPSNPCGTRGLSGTAAGRPSAIPRGSPESASQIHTAPAAWARGAPGRRPRRGRGGPLEVVQVRGRTGGRQRMPVPSDEHGGAPPYPLRSCQGGERLVERRRVLRGPASRTPPGGRTFGTTTSAVSAARIRGGSRARGNLRLRRSVSGVTRTRDGLAGPAEVHAIVVRTCGYGTDATAADRHVVAVRRLDPGGPAPLPERDHLLGAAPRGRSRWVRG